MKVKTLNVQKENEIVKNCAYCKSTFVARGSQRKKRIYCSIDCKHKANAAKAVHKFNCLNCKIPQRRVNPPLTRFCSDLCETVYKQKRLHGKGIL